MSDDQNKPEQTPAQTSNNEPTPAPAPAPAPASKLIPTKRSTLLWMLGVLIIGILVILWAWRIGPLPQVCSKLTIVMLKVKLPFYPRKLMAMLKMYW